MKHWLSVTQAEQTFGFSITPSHLPEIIHWLHNMSIITTGKPGRGKKVRKFTREVWASFVDKAHRDASMNWRM